MLFRNSESPIETRAAKRRRLNEGQDETTSDVKVQVNLKVDEEIDEVDKAITAADKVYVELNIRTIAIKPSDALGTSAIDILNMKTLMSSFAGNSPDQFINHCRQFVNSSTMASAEILTIDQADTPLWFEMRYGRITASRVRELLCKFNISTKYLSLHYRFIRHLVAKRKVEAWLTR